MRMLGRKRAGAGEGAVGRCGGCRHFRKTERDGRVGKCVLKCYARGAERAACAEWEPR